MTVLPVAQLGEQELTVETEPSPTAWKDCFVPAAAEGERLDCWISNEISEIASRSSAAQLIRNRCVQLDRCAAKPSLRLRAGDRVTVDLKPLLEPRMPPKAEDIPLDVLFEDEHILVIDKCPGLVVHPGAGVPNGTLVNAIVHHLGHQVPSLASPNRAGIVHRLDKDTSGVMVVAKTSVALRELSESFSKHEQKRLYQAFVYGTPCSQTVETGFGRHPTQRVKFATRPLGEGKRACTHIDVISSHLAGTVSLVQCTLETGRTHQIRVHLESLGHPIVGDPLYGSQPKSFSSRFPQAAAWIRKSVQRQLLHAVFLGVRHPVSRNPLEFQSSFRPDMMSFQNLLNKIEEQNRSGA